MSVESSAGSGSALKNVLNDLSKAESYIHNLLRLAEETCDELEKSPLTDADILNKLATDYFDSLKEMRSLVIKHVAYVGNDEGSGTLVEDIKNCSSVRSVEIDSIDNKINMLDKIEREMYK